jgi:DNA polymerase (family 10)
MLKMDTPDPENREDNGEIEAALQHKLPKLITLKDLKGDLHLHSSFPFKNPSHGPGADSLKDIVKKAKSLDYKYVGLSDHPSGHKTADLEQMKKEIQSRSREIEQLKSSNKSIRVLNGLEIDILPDGTLSVPNELLETLDYVIAGIHSGHRQTTKEQMTKRILTALENPHVDIISHPTGRLLNERDSYDADWDAIFKYAGEHNKLLEINSFYNRLDLRDDLVKRALEFGVKFVIDTDAHEISQMDNMMFGVSVARRGWAESKDIVNSWDWKEFAKWFKIGG